VLGEISPKFYLQLKRGIRDIYFMRIKEPTTKQKVAFKNYKLSELEGKPISLRKAALAAGYAVSSVKAGNLTKTKGWQILEMDFQKILDANVEEPKIIKKLNEIATGSDNRAAIGAATLIFRLKNRFPAEKQDVNSYQAFIEKIKE